METERQHRFIVTLFRDVTIRETATVEIEIPDDDPVVAYEAARDSDVQWRDTDGFYDVLSMWGNVTDENGNTTDEIDKED